MNILLIIFSMSAFMSLALLNKQAHRLNSKKVSFEFIENSAEDDSDIKIAGEDDKGDTGEQSVETDVNELEIQRASGNVEKARALGKTLTQKIISQDGESSFGEDEREDASLRTQRRLLLAFAAINTVESNVKSKVLQGVIINEFYNSLKTALPEFYDDIGESGSFSFYTLCVRRGGDVDACIGQTFAMLADKGGDNVMEELGKALYMRFVDVALNTIKSFNIKQ